MGIIRKTTSVGTLGLVRYRNKDERVNYNARLQRRHNRAQTALAQRNAHWSKVTAMQMQQQAAMPYAQPPMPAPVAGPPAPPGWYVHPDNQQILRWWNGTYWTTDTQPR